MNTTFRQTKFTKKISVNSNSKQNKSFFPNIDPYVGHSPYKLKANKKQQQKQQISMITIYNINSETTANINNNTDNPQLIGNISNGFNSSKGIDMWALNKNLKQFSETRQIGFYQKKQNKQEGKSQLRGNNIMNKTKTQEIKSVNKIFKVDSNNNQGGITNNNHEKSNNKEFNRQISQNKDKQRQRSQGHLKKLYDPNFTSRTKNIDCRNKNKGFFNDIYKLDKTIYGTLPVRKTTSHTKNSSYLNNTIYRPNQTLTYPNKKHQKSHSEQKIQLKQAINPYLKTFINGSHLKRENNHNEMGSGNLQILQMNNNNSNVSKNMKINVGNNNNSNNNNSSNNSINNNDKDDKKMKKPLSVRKNKFEKYVSNSSLQMNEQHNEQQLEDTNELQVQNYQQIHNTNIPQKPLLNNDFLSHDKIISQKKKAFQYNRSIGLINKNLLNQVDTYLECNNIFSNIPKTKVQMMMDVGWGRNQYKESSGGSYTNRGKINRRSNQKLEENNVFFSDFSFKQTDNHVNSKQFPRGGRSYFLEFKSKRSRNLDITGCRDSMSQKYSTAFII